MKIRFIPLKIIVVFVIIFLFIVSYRPQIFISGTDSVHTSALHFQQRLKELDKEFEHIAKRDTELLRGFKGIANSDSLRQWQSKPFEVEVFHGDSILFWSKNEVGSLNGLESKDDFFTIHRQNGIYIVRNISNVTVGDSFRFVFSLPVEYIYTTHNNFLQNGFSDFWNLASNIKISDSTRQGALPVLTPKKNVLCWLAIDDDAQGNFYGMYSIIFWLIAFISSLLMLRLFILKLIRRKKMEAAFSISVFTIIIYAIFIHTYRLLPEHVLTLSLFMPQLYASFIASSMAELGLDVVMIIWITSIFILFLKGSWFPLRTQGSLYLITTISIWMIYGMAFWVQRVIQSLVLDSDITFAFFNPLSPQYKTLLTYTLIAILLVCFFLTSRLVVSRFLIRRVPTRIFWISVAVNLILLTAITWLIINSFMALLISGWCLAFILSLYFLRITNLLRIGFARSIVIIVLLSLTTAALLDYYNVQKEKDDRQDYTEKLSDQRDPVTEYLLADFSAKMEKDMTVQDYFKNKGISYSDLVQHLQKIYLARSFNRYLINIFPLNEQGKLIHETQLNDLEGLYDIYLKSGREIIPNQLFFLAPESGDYSYLSIIPVDSAGNSIGTLLISLAIKRYKPANVYPELIMDEKYSFSRLSDVYSSGLYFNGRLIEEDGSFLYPYYLKNFAGSKNNDYFFSTKGYSHFLHQANPHQTLVVSKQGSLFTDLISHFSYLFLLLFLISGFFVLGAIIRNRLVHKTPFSWLGISLRSFVQTVLVLLVILLVVMVAWVSSLLVIKQYTLYAREKLTEKIQQGTVLLHQKMDVIRSVTPELTKVGLINGVVQDNINNIAEWEEIDINFYRTNGKLLIASQPAIFDQNIISRLMDPAVYYELSVRKQTEFFHSEKISSLHYLSGYKMMHDGKGLELGIINIPYFDTSKGLIQQIGYYFAALVNFLVFVLIICAILIPYVVRFITQKLSVVSSKMREVNLNKVNEPIIWKHNDELADLVNEFNKMVAKLDDSASRLAQSQRETAWRDMAKQVAHEIKNPLTPMKLSIQHLQRAYDSDKPGTKEMIQRVTKTLLEQIESLSQIASEFSSFAKMPPPHNEIIHIHTLLKNTITLYREHGNMSLIENLNATDDSVFADPNQMLRVLSNVVVNAVQAIPDGRKGIITINTSNSDGRILIEVKDNGKGISDTESESVFKPNFTTKSSGMGLGLAISKNIIEMGKGKMWFESRVNQYTSFFIELPVSRGEENMESPYQNL